MPSLTPPGELYKVAAVLFVTRDTTCNYTACLAGYCSKMLIKGYTALILLSYWSQSFDDKCATLIIHVQATSANGGNMSKLWDAGGSPKEIWFQHWSLLQWSSNIVLNLMNWFIRWFINSLITWWMSCHMQGVHTCIIKAHMCWFLSEVASNIAFSWSTNTFSSTVTEIMLMP